MNICEPCEQFKTRVKEWNYCSGAIDPLPYIDDVIKPHKHLMFEGRRSDGAGGHVHLIAVPKVRPVVGTLCLADIRVS